MSEDNRKYAVALFEFKARNSFELSFNKSEVLIILNQDQPEWWKATTLDSTKEGLIPPKYVLLAEKGTVLFNYQQVVKAGDFVYVFNKENNDWWKVSNNGTDALLPSGFVQIATEQTTEVISQYDFKGDLSAKIPQLPLKKGVVVIVLKKSGQWWTGKVQGSETVGIFPCNYVKAIEKPPVEEKPVKLPTLPLPSSIPSQDKSGESSPITSPRGSFSPRTSSASPRTSPREALCLPASPRVQPKWISGTKSTVKRHGIPNDPSSTFTVTEIQEYDFNAPFLELLQKRMPEKADSKSSDKLDVDTIPINFGKRFQLLFEFRTCSLQIGEESELNFSLYNRNENKTITEEFQMIINKTGVPTEILEEHKLKTIFKDIEWKEIQTTDLYLVCRIVRRGKIKYDVSDQKKQKTAQDFRRPYGSAIIALKDLWGTLNINNIEQHAVDIVLQVYSPKEESAFPNLTDMLAARSQSVELRKGEIKASFTLHNATYKELIIKSPGLGSVSVTNKFEFNSEIVYFEDKRHDLYITLESGEFSQGKNIEVVVEVKLDDGERYKDCISLGPTIHKASSEFRTIVCYHSTSPKWGETIKLSIPDHLFPKAHLKLDARHCSSAKVTPFFSFAFLKLVTPEGTVVHDGEHILPCYKPLDKGKKPAYLTEGAEGVKGLSVRKSEHIKIRTQLTSKNVFQDISLLCLSNWRNQKNVTEILTNLSFLSNYDIMKYFCDVMDALIAMLDNTAVADTIEPETLMVYDSIIKIFGMANSAGSKYGFKQLLDTYISEGLFKGVITHRHMLNCLSYFLGGIEPERNLSQINNSFKALEYIFKYMKSSILNFKFKQATNRTSMRINPATASLTDDPEGEIIKSDLALCLTSFNRLMQTSNPTLIVAQTLALRHFCHFLSYMQEFYSPLELAHVLEDFLQSVPFNEKMQKTHMEKLTLIKWTLQNTEIFKNEGSRASIMPVLLQHVKIHIDKSIEEQQECFGVIKLILQFVKDQKIPEDEQQFLTDLVGLLPVIMLVKRAESRTEAGACMLQILDLISQSNLSGYTNKLSSREKQDFLESLCKYLESTLSDPLFSSKWKDLLIYQAGITLKLLKIITPLVMGYAPSLAPPASEDGGAESGMSFTLEQRLFSSFFLLATTLIQEKSVTYITDKFGDIQSTAAALCNTSWKSLSPQNQVMLSRLFGKFVPLLIIQNETVKNAGYEMCATFVVNEFHCTSDLLATETQTIDMLDRLVTLRKVEFDIFDGIFERLDSSIQSVLSSLPSNFVDNSFHTRKQAFMGSMNQMLTLLFAVRTLPEGPQYEQERIEATLKVMEYLKKTERRDAYIKYVHMLYNQQEAAHNYTEAGYTLLAHIDLLEWSDKIVKPFSLMTIKFPEERQRERKERLYRMAIDLFERGCFWEKSLELIKELKKQCQFTNDWTQFIRLLELEATLYNQIGSGQRFPVEYFRVAYYGKGFPPNIQAKEFIYRGEPMQKTSDFIDKITQQFPNAELMKSTEATPEIINAAGQFILVTAVTAVTNEDLASVIAHPAVPDDIKQPCMQLLQRRRCTKKTPTYIKKFEERNEATLFVYSKPIRRGLRIPENDFSDLWLNNTYLLSEITFPSLYKRSLVVKSFALELNPIENAITSIETKTQDLKGIIDTIERQAMDALSVEEINISSLSMNLNGIIDAAVNGGIGKYKEAFLVPHQTNAVYSEQLKNELRDALKKQLEVVEAGLIVHAQHCNTELKGLHEKLTTFFEKMKVEILTA